jgi:hypothetical protein
MKRKTEINASSPSASSSNESALAAIKSPESSLISLC